MSHRQTRTGLLKLALLGDAVASGATGVLMAAGAGILFGLLGLPEVLMRYAGLFLIPYALFVAFVGTRPVILRGAVLTIIAANGIWAIGSGMLLVTGALSPTALGYMFVIVQAVVVAGFAVAQQIGLKQAQADRPLSA